MPSNTILEMDKHVIHVLLFDKVLTEKMNKQYSYTQYLHNNKNKQ